MPNLVKTLEVLIRKIEDLCQNKSMSVPKYVVVCLNQRSGLGLL